MARFCLCKVQQFTIVCASLFAVLILLYSISVIGAKFGIFIKTWGGQLLSHFLIIVQVQNIHLKHTLHITQNTTNV